ncbi:MAG TPA: fatty acid desaturase [Pirellulales bacterium]|nr:fatty acid desaturase [Pirellulales bacterium]
MIAPRSVETDREIATRPLAKQPRTGLFAHSRLDSLLAAMAGVQLAVLLYGAWTCGGVPWSVTLGLAAISVFLMCTNFQCTAHNFIHNPFFRSRRLNAVFSLINSLLLGGSQTLYRLHHLHHHKYNNDLPDPRTGTTNDFTSTWRYGRPPKHEESIVSYALLGYFRSDFRLLLREARRRRVLRNVAWELATLGAMLVVLATINFRGLLCFYLPVWFFGNAAAMAENYLEHHGAAPGNRQTDSVSCYNPLYNFVWFNNGYHQEHHYRPQLHWTRVPDVRRLLPPESQRRVVRGAHWFNFAANSSMSSDRLNGPGSDQCIDAGAFR